MTPVQLAPHLSTPVRSALYRIGHRLIDGRLGPPMEAALEDIADATRFERVLILAASVQGFEVVGARGFPVAGEHLIRAPLAAALVARAAENHKVAFLARGMELEGLDVAGELHTMDCGLAMAIPLTLGRSRVERERRRDSDDPAPVVLYLETTAERTAPTLAERSLISLNARQALTSVIASKLFAETARDASTGCFLRGHFERALREELAWAREVSQPLALLILVLVGQGTGSARDRALARAAEVVSVSLRRNDLVGRYGPDELAILLEGANAEAAQGIARRLQARLAAASLAGYVGAACFPDHADSATTLLTRADQAAVAAGSHGRPQLWSPGLPDLPGRTERLRALLTGEAAEDYRRVQVLLDTAQAVNSSRDTHEVMRAALQSVLTLTGADRALVLLGRTGDLSLEAGLDRSGETLAADTVFSRSIPRQVLRTQRAVCLRDTTGKAVGTSVEDLALRSILCVPLQAAGRTLGVLYVDSLSASHDLAERDLAFFEALAAHIALALQNARLADGLREENALLRRTQDEVYPVEGIIAASPNMKRVLREVRDIAESSSTVLILGESGTGKELVARALHRLGPTPDGPFVAQNCAAIPQELLESELFGHVAGAFSGATRTKKGLLELAQGGTFFLDEIGNLNLLLQAKLLRVLEERALRRLGDVRTIPIDFRLISATNKDLLAAVEAGTFRADLYYRLNVLSVELPPLKERREDIPLLLEHFIERHVEDRGLKEPTVTQAAMEALLQHGWPGNVRELMNTIEKGMVLARGGELTPRHLGLSRVEAPPAQGGTLRELMETTERCVIERALRDHEGNVTRAAKSLGVARQQLQRLIKRHGLT